MATAIARYARLRLLARIGRHPSAILLLAQLAALLAYPFFEGTPAGAAWFGAFGAVVLLLAMRMVHRTAGHARFVVALALALPAIASNLVATVGGVAWLVPWSAALEALFYFHAAACLVAYMRQAFRSGGDAEFLLQFPDGAGKVVLSSIEMTGGAAVPFAWFLVFEMAAKLEENLSIGIENKDMDGAVQPAVGVNVAAQCLTHDTILFVDHVEDFVTALRDVFQRMGVKGVSELHPLQ